MAVAPCCLTLLCCFFLVLRKEMAALAVAARVVFVIKMGSAIFAKDSEEVVIQLQKRP